MINPQLLQPHQQINNPATQNFYNLFLLKNAKHNKFLSLFFINFC